MPSAYDYIGRSTNFTGGTVSDGGVLSGLNDSISNFFTGDRTYARQLESMAFQNAFNASEAQKERDFSSSEAQKNRDWQQEMSNSAYSRAISDLKRNGVNPYAVLSGMSSASTPVGAVAVGTAARSGSGVGSGSNGFGTLISSAFSLAKAIIKGQFDVDVAKIYKRG